MGIQERVPVIFAADCPPCADCGEPYCETHKEHHSECGCLKPGNAAERGYRITVEGGKVWGVKR